MNMKRVSNSISNWVKLSGVAWQRPPETNWPKPATASWRRALWKQWQELLSLAGIEANFVVGNYLNQSHWNCSRIACVWHLSSSCSQRWSEIRRKRICFVFACSFIHFKATDHFPKHTELHFLNICYKVYLRKFINSLPLLRLSYVIFVCYCISMNRSWATTTGILMQKITKSTLLL